MICGEPGIGKSTLVLQSCLACAKDEKRTLYITAEESDIQVKERAKRLIKQIPEKMLIASITDMESIIEIIQNEKPEIIILDSIQMVMVKSCHPCQEHEFAIICIHVH